MPSKTQTSFTYTDPRYFDGDPYVAAGKAVDQTRAIAALLLRAINDAEVLARNAQLQRHLAETPDDARAEAWDGSAQQRKFAGLIDDTEAIQAVLRAIRVAAAFNPQQLDNGA